MKLIHAKQIAKVENTNPVMPAPTWPAASMCDSSDAATPNATTKVRSNSSSRGVATRCLSCGSRPRIGVNRCARTELCGSGASCSAPSMPWSLQRIRAPSGPRHGKPAADPRSRPTTVKTCPLPRSPSASFLPPVSDRVSGPTATRRICSWPAAAWWRGRWRPWPPVPRSPAPSWCSGAVSATRSRRSWPTNSQEPQSNSSKAATPGTAPNTTC